MNSTHLQAAWFGAPANKSASKFPIDVPYRSNFFEEAMDIAISKAEKTLQGARNLMLSPEFEQGSVEITSLKVKGIHLQGFRVRTFLPIYLYTRDSTFSNAIAFKGPELDFSENTIWEMQPFGKDKFHYVGQKGSGIIDYEDDIVDKLDRDYDLPRTPPPLSLPYKLKTRRVKKINQRNPVIYDGAVVWAKYEFDMLPHFIEGLPQSVSSQLPVPSGQAGQGILDSEKLEEAIDRIDDILTDYEEEIWVLENSALGQAHSALEDYKRTMEKALSKMR